MGLGAGGLSKVLSVDHDYCPYRKKKTLKISVVTIGKKMSGVKSFSLMNTGRQIHHFYRHFTFLFFSSSKC